MRTFLDRDDNRDFDSKVKPKDPYDNLPAALQYLYTRQEYNWLSDADKATLEQRECEPGA